MNNVGINAVDDFCRNVATDTEIARLRMALDEREKTLRTRGVPPIDPMVVTRDLVSAHQHSAGDLVYIGR